MKGHLFSNFLKSLHKMAKTLQQRALPTVISHIHARGSNFGSSVTVHSWFSLIRWAWLGSACELFMFLKWLQTGFNPLGWGQSNKGGLKELPSYSVTQTPWPYIKSDLLFFKLQRPRGLVDVHDQRWIRRLFFSISRGQQISDPNCGDVIIQ